MKCPECSADNAASAKFCQSCGAGLATVSPLVNRSSVDLAWTLEAAARAGYAPDAQPKDGDISAICRAPGKSVIVIGVVAQPGLVTVQGFWGMKKVPMLKRWAFAEALNKANGSNWICAVYTTPDGESLAVSGSMYLPEMVSALDVAGFIDNFQALAVNVITTSGLTAFA